MVDQLKTSFHVEYIHKLNIPFFLKIVFHLKNLLTTVIFSKKISKNKNIIISKYYSYQISKFLKNSKNFDLIFAPTASTEIAFIKTSIPIVYLSDSTFDQLYNYYDDISNFTKRTINECSLIEKNALNNAQHIVFSSDWAKNFAIQYYNISEKKISVIPFGANLEIIPNSYIKKCVDKNFNILFLSKFWKRKRGDLVLNVFDELINIFPKKNINLFIVGIDPRLKNLNNKIKVYQFLNKAVDEESKLFYKILSDSHILFLPSVADCTPIVFCESFAYSIPVVSTNTGGISSIVSHGRNGFLLDEDSTISDYTNVISKIISDPDLYASLSRFSRTDYQDKFNWDNWRHNFNVVINKFFYKI